VLIAMSDFKQLCIEDVARKERNRALFRDHGHEETIKRSYAMSAGGGRSFAGSEVAYVWETAELFLATRDALEQKKVIELEPYSPSRLEG
jgi:hypothetical protein